MPYRRTNVKRRALGLLAVFGLISQACLTAFTLPAHGLSATAGSDPAVRSIVICTGEGLARILLDAEGNPVDKSAPDGHGTICSLCCALSCCGKIAQAPTAWSLGPTARGQAAPPPPAERDDARTPRVRKGHDPPRPA